MSYRDELVQRALATRDPIKLFQLFEAAIDMSDGLNSQLAFAKNRVTKLEEQVKRQTAMIDNLEKTLWGKK